MISRWKRVQRASGASVLELMAGTFRGDIFQVDRERYTYNVTELPMTENSFHQRGTTKTLKAAKAAVSRLLSQFGNGAKSCIHCGRPVPRARVASVCNRCIAKYRRGSR